MITLAAIDDMKYAISEESHFNELPVEQFPCGFAWICIKIRKNAKESKILTNEGFHWDEYRRSYLYSMKTHSQSMQFKERCLRKGMMALRSHGIDCRIQTYID